MTSMQQIEYIAVQARKLGLKYGDYVAKYGDTLPLPDKEKMDENKRVCEKCGAIYTQSGNSKSKYCRACADGKTDDGSNDICKWCGKPYHKIHGHQKFCSPGCAKEHKAAYYKEYDKKKKAEREKMKNEKRKKSGDL